MLQTYYPVTDDGAAHFTDQQCAQVVTKDGLTIDSAAAEQLVAYGLLRVGDPTKKTKQASYALAEPDTDGTPVPSFNPLDATAPNAPAFPPDFNPESVEDIREAQAPDAPATNQTSKGD